MGGLEGVEDLEAHLVAGVFSFLVFTEGLKGEALIKLETVAGFMHDGCGGITTTLDKGVFKESNFIVAVLIFTGIPRIASEDVGNRNSINVIDDHREILRRQALDIVELGSEPVDRIRIGQNRDAVGRVVKPKKRTKNQEFDFPFMIMPEALEKIHILKFNRKNDLNRGLVAL